MGSKLRQIGTKGLQALDLSTTDKTNIKSIYKKRHFFARLSSITLISISLLHFYLNSNQIDITKAKLDEVFNANTTTSILTMLSYISAIKIMITQLLHYIISLPYISLFALSVQFFIQYVYKFIGGDVWSVINDQLTNFIEPSVARDEFNGFSTMMLNVSGCFISTFLLFLHGLELGQIFLLLLWSCNVIIPTLLHGVTELRDLLILDLIQVWVFRLINFFFSMKSIYIFYFLTDKLDMSHNNAICY